MSSTAELYSALESTIRQNEELRRVTEVWYDKTNEFVKAVKALRETTSGHDPRDPGGTETEKWLVGRKALADLYDLAGIPYYHSTSE